MEKVFKVFFEPGPGPPWTPYQDQNETLGLNEASSNNINMDNLPLGRPFGRFELFGLVLSGALLVSKNVNVARFARNDMVTEV